MTVKIKAGTATAVCGHSEGYKDSPKLKEFDATPVALAGSEQFLEAMEEGFSAEETSQSNPFEFPAAISTKPRTFSEAVQEVTLRFKLMMVACWLPKDYRVLPPQRPMPDPMMVDLSKELKAIAHKLWESYEPLLGAHNTTTVLQVEAPPELEEE
jgi:hypothetical protein